MFAYSELIVGSVWMDVNNIDPYFLTTYSLFLPELDIMCLWLWLLELGWMLSFKCGFIVDFQLYDFIIGML
jgi:hypothetical protein